MESVEEQRLLGFDESIAITISTSNSIELEASKTQPKRGSNKNYDFFSEYQSVDEAKKR
jgi:hypothetical protein